MHREFAVEMSVSGIIGMDRNGGISKHCLRTGGGDNDALLCRSAGAYNFKPSS
jgi:hypothetical protein